MADQFDEMARDLFHYALATAQESSCVLVIAAAIRDAVAAEREAIATRLDEVRDACRECAGEIGRTKSERVAFDSIADTLNDQSRETRARGGS
jgi:hypothetical protein